MSDLSRFYEAVQKSSDEIQHYGNKNSGRYRRGSGKNHTGSAHDQNRTDSQKQEARNIRRNARKAKQAYRRAVKGKRVWRVKRVAKKMRKAGLISRFDARTMRKNARVDKRQLKRLKPQVQEMNNIIRASRVSLKDAKSMYNAPEMKTLETLYIRNEKPMDINQAANDGPTIEQVYDSMSPDQKSVCMYVASEIAGSENEPDDIGEDPNIIHASGSDFVDTYDSMSDEHKAVIILVASQMMAENNIGGEEVKQIITHGPSPWSAEFYLGSQNAPALEQSGVKGMKWKQHLKAKTEDLVDDVKNVASKTGNAIKSGEKSLSKTAAKAVDKIDAKIGNAHTKKIQEDMDVLSNFLAELYPNGYDSYNNKQMTYKDILGIVKSMPGVHKWSEKDQAALAAQAARAMIRGTSATSVEGAKEEQLNKIKSVPYNVGTQPLFNPVELTESLNRLNNASKISGENIHYDVVRKKKK